MEFSTFIVFMFDILDSKSNGWFVIFMPELVKEAIVELIEEVVEWVVGRMVEWAVGFDTMKKNKELYELQWCTNNETVIIRTQKKR